MWAKGAVLLVNFYQKSKMQGTKSQISAPVQSLISEINRAYHHILFIFFLHFKMEQIKY